MAIEGQVSPAPVTWNRLRLRRGPLLKWNGEISRAYSWDSLSLSHGAVLLLLRYPLMGTIGNMMADPGNAYILYFTKNGGGSVGLKLDSYPDTTFGLRWVNIGTGNWGSTFPRVLESSRSFMYDNVL